MALLTAMAVTRLYALLLVPVLYIYAHAARSYLRPARDLFQLERMAQQSARVHVAETLTGARVVRAFGLAHVHRVLGHHFWLLDIAARDAHLGLHVDQWLSLRVQMYGAVIVGIVAGSAFIALRQTLSGGLLALALYEALVVDGGALESLVRVWAWLSPVFSTAARTEAAVRGAEVITANVAYSMAAARRGSAPLTPIHTESNPSLSWPTKGDLRFDAVSFRDPAAAIVEDLADIFEIGDGGAPPLSLKGVSFRLQAGEKVAVLESSVTSSVSSVGRALLRVHELTAGRIVVDGVDIATLGLRTLRSRVACVSAAAPNTALYDGSVRMQLNPSAANIEDERLWAVLRAVGLSSDVATLDGPFPGVAGLCQNPCNRFLLSLARALLSEPSLVVLALAPVLVLPPEDDLQLHPDPLFVLDDATTTTLQRVIHEELHDATVLLLLPSSTAFVQQDQAQRSLLLKDVDRVLVVVDGEMSELSTPAKLAAMDQAKMVLVNTRLDGGPFNLYTQALLLKDQREFAAASDLLRALLSNASLSLEANHHLAQCLIAQDPALNWCLNETTQCLEHVVATVKSLTTGTDANHLIMYRESLELLAHVLVAGGRFDRALHLLDALDEINVDTNPVLDHAVHRHQQVLVGFQRAFCRYARGDPADVVSAELLRVLSLGRETGQVQEQEKQSEVLDPLDGIDLLLRADAEGLRQGLALMARANFQNNSTEGCNMVIVRYSASKVALVTGLHDFGDPAEELLNCVYQDRDELLDQDAARLQLRLVSKDEELATLVDKSGSAAPQLRAALRWAERATPARVGAAKRVLEGVEKRLKEAQSSKKLAKGEVEEARKLLAEKIHTSVGTRNESLALEAYERQTGSKVRHTNEHIYYLTFPPPPKVDGIEKLMSPGDDAEGTTVDYSVLVEQSRRTVVPKRKTRKRCMSVAVKLSSEEGTMVETQVEEQHEESMESEEEQQENVPPAGYFSVCGMVDGVADALIISGDDEWELTPIVVEVKNRMRGFRKPPPLYDQVQLAVYMKMLGLEQGDLVQCMYGTNSKPSIQVSRIVLGAPPLCLPAAGGKLDIWTNVVVPRLYAYTATVQKLRDKELLRLAFLNGTEEERRAVLRAECDFL
ncbi:hypothetical protein BBP00_00004560 [Phytophthora kernoviae]|uniref:ABC transmembrane type-1 domain-containing protein n=1 Tax=Phytophthora kernoviae TaxID=325452 RepID=A0A3F2RRC8_9STRA|nr:hypothetical protein BBP00_00004560 [Phytophthora kernoviae]